MVGRPRRVNITSFHSRHIPFESSSFIGVMGEPWSDIVAHLRSQRLLALNRCKTVCSTSPTQNRSLKRQEHSTIQAGC